MNPVVHFELPYDDRERISRFYREAFDWELQPLGAEMGDYVLATTAEPGSRHGPPHQAASGAINGGFFPRKPDWPAQHPSVVIGVPDMGEALARVNAAAGRVLGEPKHIPGVGEYVAFYDTEGNRLSMLQPVATGRGER